MIVSEAKKIGMQIQIARKKRQQEKVLRLLNALITEELHEN